GRGPRRTPPTTLGISRVSGLQSGRQVPCKRRGRPGDPRLGEEGRLQGEVGPVWAPRRGPRAGFLSRRHVGLRRRRRSHPYLGLGWGRIPGPVTTAGAPGWPVLGGVVTRRQSRRLGRSGLWHPTLVAHEGAH